MSYSADTFVADEQPTTAKWNKLWSNDASFNDGTGIADNAILQRHLSSNIVGVDEIATGAILLGYDTKTDANFTTSSTSSVQVTGLSVTVTIPSGSKIIEVIATAGDHFNASGTANYHVMSIWEGTVGSGTEIGSCQFNGSGVDSQACAVARAIYSPSAGSKTYNVSLRTNAGTAGLEFATTRPGIISVYAH